MTDYDDDGLERAAAADVKALEGCLLREVLVHIVEPEFNVFFLVTDDGVWGISGRVGSEVLSISRAQNMPNDIQQSRRRSVDTGPTSSFKGDASYRRGRSVRHGTGTDSSSPSKASRIVRCSFSRSTHLRSRRTSRTASGSGSVFAPVPLRKRANRRM